MHRNPCWPQAGQYWYGVLSDGKGIFYSSVLFLTFLNPQVMFYLLQDQFPFFWASFVTL